MKILCIICIISLLALTSCTTAEQNINPIVEETTNLTADWCQPKVEKPIMVENALVKLEIIGIQQEGPQKGLCYSKQITSNEELGDIVLEMWKDQSGNTKYMQNTVNGQTQKVELS